MRSKGGKYVKFRLYCAAILAALFVVLLAVPPAHAQVLYGSVVGQVEDPSGAMIPKAAVVLTNKQTGAVRETTTDDAGRFSVLNLLPGLYDVKVTASGFRTLSRTDIDVSINTVTRQDLKMEVGQTSEQVTVSATAAQLQTDKSDVRHEITGETIQNLPLPAYRNYQSLMALVPGATPPAFQNAVVDTPGRALRSFVNGTATNNNNTLTDGAVNINIWLPHHVAYVQPVESIETVNISTGSFDAEQGMAGGAAVTVVTKSGTNNLHGTGWWFHTNQHLHSDPVYFRPTGYKRPLNILNIFGGNVGGPIKKDKLFYFFNFERTTERTGYFSSYSVAPEDFRRGDFSRYLPGSSQYPNASSIVYDPLSAPVSATPTTRTPFAGNIIPANRINPIFPNIYRNMPLPNQILPTDTSGGLGGNYGVSAVLRLNRNQYDTKVNYNVNSKLTTWGKYSRMDAPVQGKYPFGDLGGAALGTAGFGDTTTQLVTGGYNVTLSPTFIFDGVFGYTRMDQFVGIPNVDRNIGLDEWKIPGTNGGQRYKSDTRYGGAPAITGFGFSDIGALDTWTPVWRAERSYTYQTNFSKIFNAHEVRFGFEARRMELNHWQPETANPRGSVNFGSGVTNVPGQVARTANSYASALLGYVSTYSKSVQYFEMKTREWQYAFYVRDRWQLSRNLTVNLGLRYEYYPLINRGDRGIERWDPFANVIYFGGLGQTPRDAGITVSKRLFAPRIGLAWRFTEKSVFRVGYGMTYDPLPFGRPLRGLYPATITGSYNPASAGSNNTYGWFNTINVGIPEIPVPDVSSGRGTLPNNLDMGPRSPWGGMLNRGYIMSWNAMLQRQLPWSMVGEVGYVATRTIHQLIDRNINSAGPGSNDSPATSLPLARLYGRTIGASMWDGIGIANYHSLQSSLNKSFTNGLMMKVNYTFGKSLSMADEDGWVGLPLYNWEPMIYKNYARSGYDRTHMFSAGWNYELPVGAGKKWQISNKAANFIGGGWKVSGTFVAYSGTPFTVTGSGSSLQAVGNSQTADQIGPIKKIGELGPGKFFYDPTAFMDPLIYQNAIRAATGQQVYRFGSMGRNVLSGPGYWQLHPAIYKNFKIREKASAEFRAESTNFTNTPIWGNPNAGAAGPSRNPDGSIRTDVTNAWNNFMSVTGAGTGRQFRFGLRIAF
jgi:outer membrane receptor protein involved in Fe transport